MARGFTYTPMLALALAGFAMAAEAGCGDESASDESPAGALAAVSEAGSRTFAEPTLALDLRVVSPDAHYEAAGLIELQEGRFRVELHEVTSPSDYRPRVVIGLDGEGIENTVKETTELLGSHHHQGFRRGERCWFNPHAPVGSFLGTASVEETVRVIGAVLESLGKEVRSASPAAGNAYEIVLDASATRPRSEFRQSKRRVWGDRHLLRQLVEPVKIRLSGRDTVAQITVRLDDYELYIRDRISRVRIEAKLAPTHNDLVLDPPRCQAIE
jgi:hypothetical protein